jgi:hypothetical protein
MDSKLKLIVNKNAHNFQNWNKVHYKYMDYLFGDSEYNDDEVFKITLDTVEMFQNFLSAFIKYGNYKDEWSEITFLPMFFGLFIQINSNKTGCSYDFGFDEKGFFLNYNLRYYQNIKRMNDEFWLNYITLSQCGDFEFVDNSCINSNILFEFKDTFKFNRSNLFRFIRNSIFCDTNQVHDIDFGFLQIRWENINWEQLLINGCQAFKKLYKIDYFLWKANKK